MAEAVFEAYSKMYESLFGDDVHTMMANIPAERHDAFGTNDPLLRQQGHVIRQAVNTDKTAYEAARTHPNMHVRAMAAASPLASHEDLTHHVNDKSYFVSRAAIRNPNMSIDHVKQLRLHQDPGIWQEAVERHRSHVDPDYDPRDYDLGGFHSDQEEHDLRGSAAHKAMEWGHF